MDLGIAVTGLGSIMESAATTMAGLSAYINTVLGVGLGLWAFGKFRKGS